MEARKVIDVTPVAGSSLKTPVFFSSKDSDEKIQRRDFFTALALSFLVIVLYSFGLDAFEFFRHTEADRTMIGWEMFRDGNFLVPELLSSPILTKPPLYYWSLAASFSFFGGVSEFYARFPSVFFAALSVGSSFLFLRLGRLRFDFALVSALALATSALFIQLATKAEIDMAYGAFCWMALYAGFFSASLKSRGWSLAGGALCGFAFLVKGPQILAFYAISQILFSKYALKQPLGAVIYRNLYSAFSFLLVLLCWLVPLAQQVGLEALAHQFDVEVLQRFGAESSKGRAWYFYIFSAFAGLLPWSFFIIGALYLRYHDKNRISGLLSAERLFLRYSLYVLVAGLVLLSMSAGKSSRYWFPLFCSGVNLSVWAAYYVRGSNYEKFLAKTLTALSLVLGVVSVALAFAGYFAPGAVLFFAAFFISYKNKFPEFERWKAIVALCLLVVGVRAVEVSAFSEYRNDRYQIPELAAELLKPIEENGSDVFTVELFSRWLVYYLQQEGVEVKRLSKFSAPSTADSLLLLDGEDELWRLEEIQRLGGTYEELAAVENHKNKWLLIKVSSEVAGSMKTAEIFPTSYSEKHF